MNRILLLISLCALAFATSAQESEAPEGAAATPAPEKQQPTADKKMVREANINLQTTVTGNQEQPRVMYILPWQSPSSPELEMDMLSSQDEAVFGHVERDELARELEAAGEWDQVDE